MDALPTSLLSAPQRARIVLKTGVRARRLGIFLAAFQKTVAHSTFNIFWYELVHIDVKAWINSADKDRLY